MGTTPDGSRAVGRWRARPGAWSLAVLLLAAAAPAAAEVLSFGRFNQSYRDPLPALPPIEQGPVRISLAVPSYFLTLRSHRITLDPLADGSHRARLDLEFLGRGHLVADLAVGDSRSRLEDDLVAPLQRRSLEGRVRLVRGRTGYVLTLLALPERFEVEVGSRLATDLAAVCSGLSALAFGALDCGGLERRLSVVSVPLPAPGETRFLADQDLTAEERSALDRYLARAAAAALGAGGC